MRGNVSGHGRHADKTARSAPHAISVARPCAPRAGPRAPAPGPPAAPGRLPRRPALGAVREAGLLPGAPDPRLPAGSPLPVGRRPCRPRTCARSGWARPSRRGRRGRRLRQGKGAGGGRGWLRRPKIRSPGGRRRGRNRRARRPERRPEWRTDGRRPGRRVCRRHHPRRRKAGVPSGVPARCPSGVPSGVPARCPSGVPAGASARCPAGVPAGCPAGPEAGSSAGPVRLDLGSDIDGRLLRLFLRTARRDDGGDDVARGRVAPGAREALIAGRVVADGDGVLRRVRQPLGGVGRFRRGGGGGHGSAQFRLRGGFFRGVPRPGGSAGVGGAAHGEDLGRPRRAGGDSDKAEQEPGGGENGIASFRPANTRGTVHAASIAGPSLGVYEKPPGETPPPGVCRVPKFRRLAPRGGGIPGPPGRADAGGQKDAWASPQSLLVFTEQGGSYVQ